MYSGVPCPSVSCTLANKSLTFLTRMSGPEKRGIRVSALWLYFSWGASQTNKYGLAMGYQCSSRHKCRIHKACTKFVCPTDQPILNARLLQIWSATADKLVQISLRPCDLTIVISPWAGGLQRTHCAGMKPATNWLPNRAAGFIPAA